jgi:glycosidase
MFTVAGAPCVYYGDEIGLDGRHDPECRKCFPWDAARWDQDLLAYLKACVKLRSSKPALRSGSFRRMYAEGQVVAFLRSLDHEHVLVVLNAGNEAKELEISETELGLTKPAVAFGKAGLTAKGGQLRLQLQPRHGVVITSRA